MQWGGPWTSRWGGNEEQIKRLELKEVLGGVRIRASMIDGYAQFCRVVIDGINGPMKKVSDGDTLTEIIAPWPRPSASDSPALTSHLISLVPMGDGALPNFDATFQQILYSLVTPNNIAVQITAVPSYFCYHDAGTITDLTGWEIYGLKRFSNCKPVRNRKTWAKMEVSLVTAFGIRTVTLSVDGVPIASGTRSVLAGNGSISLLELNGSGIQEGTTVNLTYSADFTDGILIARFPAQYKIHHRKSAFGGGDFPRTAEKTLYDDGRKSVFQWSGSTLAAGIEYVVIHQVDEDGNESNGTMNATIVIYAEPLAAGAPSYLSGSSLNTAIQFAASLTPNAVYNIYDSLDTGILDMDATDNILLYSEDLTNAVWVKTDATVTGGETSPQNAANANKIIFNAFVGLGNVIQNTGVAAIANKAVVASMWVKGTPGEAMNLIVYGSTSGITFRQIVFDSSEWTRIFVCVQSIVGNILLKIAPLGNPQTVYVFGAQIERSGSMHPYRKTTAAIVTTTARLQHATGAGTLSQALTALGAGFTGSRHIVVKSAGVDFLGTPQVNSGIESKAVKELTIDYVAGVAQVAAIPPAPSVTERLVRVSGRTINVPCSLLIIEQLAAATKIKLWITPVGTPVNFASAPNGTVTLGSRVGKVVNATVSATAGGNGAYNIAVRSETAGAVRSTNTDEHGPYELTTVLPSNPDVLLRGGPA